MKKIIYKLLLFMLMIFPHLYGEEVFIEHYGMEQRTAFKEGKIGERYVPVTSYTSNSGYTETYYINGERIEKYIPGTSSTSYYGGNTEDIYGFSAVYRFDNSSDNNYMVTIKAEWDGVYSNYQTYNTGSWGVGGDTRNQLSSNKSPASYTTTFLIDKNSSFKDQFAVGEKIPENFKIKTVDIIKLDEDYYNDLKKVLLIGANTNIVNLNINNELSLIKKFLDDEKAEFFHQKLLNNLDRLIENYQSKFSNLNKTKSSISVNFNKNNFDQDFETPVKVTIKVPQPMIVNIKGSFIDEWVKVDKEITKTYMVKDIAQSNITATIIDVKNLNIIEEQMYVKSYNLPGIKNYITEFPYGKYISEIKKEKEKIESIDKNMVFVEGGEFTLGNNLNIPMVNNFQEYPIRKVKMNSYYIGKYEITQKQFKDFMRYIPEDSDYEIKNVDNFPVTGIGIYEILLFANRVSLKAGLIPVYLLRNIVLDDGKIIYADISINEGGTGYRLPFADEWEYAARGGKYSKSYKFSGSNILDEVGWYEKNTINDSEANEIKAIGLKRPNELGIYDMSGNVSEITHKEKIDAYPHFRGGDAFTEEDMAYVFGDTIFNYGGFRLIKLKK